ncbi:MAG: glycosyltransferase family 39 protein [Deltaproteobacteria bacterium]|nr:glycosyltransferase family 39 protein [Deltaproteobacteria bacterium]
MKRTRRSTAIALVLATAYFVILFATANAVGFVRDEGYYFKAGGEYMGFFDTLFSSRFLDAFSDAEIERHLGFNTEHPPLAKFTFGIMHRILHDWLGLTSNAQGFRAGGFLFAALSVIATFLLGRTLVSPRVGLLAAAGLACLPRYFFDAHLACFDVAITALWTFSLLTFYRALYTKERPNRYALVAAIVFGLALATKLNALFLPVVWIFMWWVAPPAPIRFRLERNAKGGFDVSLPPIPKALIACAVVGPLVFIAVWPHLWHDTFARIGAYIAFHLRHEHYPISWFHSLLVEPPFPVSFPVVMSALTIPGPILVLGAMGFGVTAFRVVRHRSRSDTLLLASIVLPILLIALPTTPIFGGVKHWYNAMPALSIVAARTLDDAVRRLRVHLSRSLEPLLWRRPSRPGRPGRHGRHMRRVLMAAATTAATSLFLLPGVLGCWFSHPNGIGFYNELAGGFRGGAALGLQRGFWGYYARPLYEALGRRSNTDRSQGGLRVFFNRTNYDSYAMYRRDGVIPSNVTYANEAAGADIGIAFEQPEHAHQEGAIWATMGTRPYDGVYQDNVTLVQAYARGPSSQPPPEVQPDRGK